MTEELKSSVDTGSKEAEKMPPILLVYRENDLFKKYIPEIVETLKSVGRQVDIQSFTKNTNEENIKKWAEEHQSELKDDLVLTDFTCSSASNDGVKKQSGFKPGGYIDRILNNATARAVLGLEYKKTLRYGSLILEQDYETGSQSDEKAIIAIVKRILDRKENLPTKVYIDPNHMSDHWPGYGRDVKKDKDKIEELIADEFKIWLTQAGISEDSIKVGRLAGDDKIQVDQPSDWIIVDRHNRLIVDNAKKFELPLSDFFTSTIEQKLIDVSQTELDDAVKQLVQEDFEKKE